MPDLELNLGERPAPRPPSPKKRTEEPLSLELAVDPRDLIQERAGPAHAATHELSAGMIARPSQGGAALAPLRQAELAVGDHAFDARLLADFGEPPRHWLLTPLYAWRVMKRQRELRAARVGRSEEARRAADEVEDALVALAERVRPAAEKQSTYVTAIEDLRRAEEVLRSRDRVLATDQDAQNARLAQVDARLSKLESELAQAQAEERAVVAEMGAAQAALGREDAKLKRAEIELRAAQQREATGSSSS